MYNIIFNSCLLQSILFENITDKCDFLGILTPTKGQVDKEIPKSLRYTVTIALYGIVGFIAFKVTNQLHLILSFHINKKIEIIVIFVLKINLLFTSPIKVYKYRAAKESRKKEITEHLPKDPGYNANFPLVRYHDCILPEDMILSGTMEVIQFVHK